MNLKHLLLPTRETRNIDLFLEVCFWSDIQAIRLAPGTESRLAPEWTLTNTTVHGGPTFCRTVASALGGSVLEPAPDFLPTLPREYVRRQIALMALGEARGLTMPMFIKPVADKRFRAAVYGSGAELTADAALDLEPVLVSDPVVWDHEFRVFVLDYQVRSSSPYSPHDTVTATEEQHEGARAFVAAVLADKRVQLPRSVVLDVGWIRGIGWAVIEANEAVMNGIYDCDPIAVLEVLEYGITGK